MIIVVSPEYNAINETVSVNKLFDAGLQLFHVRKPDFAADDMKAYILAIEEQYRPRLVVHQHHPVASDLGIHRFHVKEYERLSRSYLRDKQAVLSTSVHRMEDFNALPDDWDYAFVSPVFASVSKKGYGADRPLVHELYKRDNRNVRLIALGGISPVNSRLLTGKVDGVAILGCVWQSENPLKVYQSCSI